MLNLAALMGDGNVDEVIEIDHKHLRDQIRVCYSARLPLFIWGKTGIGKSESVIHATKDLGIEVIDVRISQLDSSDLRGLPKYEEDETRWLPPSWLPKDGKGILFLDELNLAPPSIQSACYQLILDRRIGEYVLPEGWGVVAAGNSSEDRANIFNMAGPLRNRLLQVVLSDPSIKEWTEWASENKVSGDIISFLNWKPDYLHTFYRNKDAHVFATPRSWANVSRLLSVAAKNSDIKQLVSSAVGQGIAIEFCAFLKLNSKFDINEILKRPELAKNIKDVSLKYALVSALAGKYLSSRESLKNIIGVSNELDAEFGILLGRMLKNSGKHFAGDFKNLSQKGDKAVKEFIERTWKFLKE